MGFGVSPTGGMIGSDAIIGVPAAGVYRYTVSSPLRFAHTHVCALLVQQQHS
jgi:hypothetical protein